MKYLFVAMGPGETSQARALAKYIVKRGGVILFALHQRKNLHFLAKDKKFKIFLTKEPSDLKKIIERERPEVLLLFNSKMWGKFAEFQKNPPLPKPNLILAVDSNWLFNDKEYPNFPFIKWVNKYLVLFPKKIFDLGLKENGGDFKIPPQILEKIIPVGFMPSYKKPGNKILQKIRGGCQIKKKEKFIFSYFSGFGAGHRVWAFNNFVEAIYQLVKKGKKIKAIYIGPTDDLDKKKLKRNWLILKEKLSAKDYFLTLSSSDLVFQHQGMVTLSQAIASQIPVIANVSISIKTATPKLHFWEVRPFKRAGVCEMFSRSTPIKKISQKIEEFLYDKKIRKRIQKKQKLVFEKGEEKVFKIIKELIKEKGL